MISFKQKGDFHRVIQYLQNNQKIFDKIDLDKYGKEGVKALSDATPVDTGKTADSWSYEIVRKKDSISIVWNNANIQNGVPIAVILQYGHALKNGGWVQGRDYINPALGPVFEGIANKAWEEVTKTT